MIVEWRGHQIDGLARISGREGGVFARVRWPRRLRRFRKEQLAMERHFGSGGSRQLGPVKYARRMSLAAEPGAARVRRAVAERREQKIVQLSAFRGDGRLAPFQQELKSLLFLRAVCQLGCRYVMLSFYQAPAPSGGRTSVRRQRGARPNIGGHRSGRRRFERGGAARP